MTRIDELDLKAYKRGLGEGQRKAVLRIAEWWDARMGPKQDQRADFFGWLRAEFGFEAKRCRICREWKVLSDFPVAKQCRDGRYAYCRTCEAVKDRQRRERNPEATRAYFRDYYKRAGWLKRKLVKCGVREQAA